MTNLSPPSQSPTRPVRVMVVDDQAPFRDAARAVVERIQGFELVAEASSGEEAVDLQHVHHPDLVLMDINMGGIDGIEATRRIVEANATVRVVLLSTYTAADLPASAATSGAVAYLNKDDFGIRALRRLWAHSSEPDARFDDLSP